jgi:hypothetical protein
MTSSKERVREATPISCVPPIRFHKSLRRDKCLDLPYRHTVEGRQLALCTRCAGLKSLLAPSREESCHRKVHVPQTRGAEFATTPRGDPHLLAEDMQITSEQTTAEVATIHPGNGFFFKCPVGRFASLYPGLCPKCHEPLVRTDAIGSATEWQQGSANSSSALSE